MAAEGAVIQLVTRCSSEQEFIERFARFASETALVVPALPHVSVGTDGHFEICLKDRAVIMRGRCEVTEIRPVEAPPGVTTSVRALMRLRLREMDAHSCGIHLRLMERHAASVRPAAPPPPAPAAPVEEVSTGAVVAVAEARSETEPTEVSPTPRLETRVPGAAFTLPANPLGELGAGDLASFIELNLFETDASADAALVVPAGAPAASPKVATPASARAALTAARLERARRIARRVAPFAACALAGLLLGIALRSASGAAPVAEVEAPAPLPAAPPPAAPPPVEAAPPEEVPPAIASDPDPEPAAVVAKRSSRRPAKVLVTSSPRHAIITLNDRRLGRAPRIIRTQRFEQLNIEASLPGYQPGQKTVVVKGAKSKVAITLVRVSKVTAQSAPSASGPIARLQ